MFGSVISENAHSHTTIQSTNATRMHRLLHYSRPHLALAPSTYIPHTGPRAPRVVLPNGALSQLGTEATFEGSRVHMAAWGSVHTLFQTREGVLWACGYGAPFASGREE